MNLRNDFHLGILGGATIGFIIASIASLFIAAIEANEQVIWQALAAIGTIGAAITALSVSIFGNRQAENRFQRELEYRRGQKEQERISSISTVQTEMLSLAMVTLSYVYAQCGVIKTGNTKTWRQNMHRLIGPAVMKFQSAQHGPWTSFLNHGAFTTLSRLNIDLVMLNYAIEFANNTDDEDMNAFTTVCIACIKVSDDMRNLIHLTYNPSGFIAADVVDSILKSRSESVARLKEHIETFNIKSEGFGEQQTQRSD